MGVRFSVFFFFGRGMQFILKNYPFRKGEEEEEDIPWLAGKFCIKNSRIKPPKGRYRLVVNTSLLSLAH